MFTEKRLCAGKLQRPSQAETLLPALPTKGSPHVRRQGRKGRATQLRWQRECGRRTLWRREATAGVRIQVGEEGGAPLGPRPGIITRSPARPGLRCLFLPWPSQPCHQGTEMCIQMKIPATASGLEPSPKRQDKLRCKDRTGEGRKHREVSTWQKSTQRSIRRFQPSSTQSVSHCAPHHGPALVPQLAQSLLPCREMADDPGQYMSIPRPTLPPFTLTLHPNKGSLNMLGDPSLFFIYVFGSSVVSAGSVMSSWELRPSAGRQACNSRGGERSCAFTAKRVHKLSPSY